MIALVVFGLLAWQDPAPEPPPPAPAPPAEQKGDEPAAKPPGSAAAEPARPKVAEAWDDTVAKEKVKAFDKEMKDAGSLADRTRALDGIDGGSHKLLVRPLQRVIETDKSVVIKKRAADLLALQPPKSANPAIVKLLQNARVTSNTQVQASLVRALANCGYDGKQWRDIEDLFESNFREDFVCVQEAILDLVAQHQETQAVPLLLQHLDEPGASDVHGANNPPAEYWKARWHAWDVWKSKVKDALFAITGQRFSTAAEARAWLEQNPLERRKRR